MSSLSLCMAASRDGAAVRAILELARPVADEIVLGVDSRKAELILSACGDLVDQAYVYEFDGTVEQYGTWLYERCRGDWILRLDDDEPPSSALLAALPELARDRRHSLIHLPFRHLFPDRESYIVSHPWHPDYHARMLRNVPGLWSSPGRNHSSTTVLGEQLRVPEAPVYHLRFSYPDTDARLATAQRRERNAPGLMTEGYPVNAVSLPELWTGVRTAPVPDEDRPAIELVASPPPAPRPAGAPPVVLKIPEAEADRLLASRAVSPGAYRAELSISGTRPALATGTTAHLEVHARNLGDEHWPPAHQPEPPIRLAYRWLAADGETVIEPDGLRTPFAERVLPGERTVVMLAVRVPDEPGRYVLEVDVVHELVRWFDCAARLEVNVERLADPPAPGSRLARLRPDLLAELSPPSGSQGLPQVASGTDGAMRELALDGLEHDGVGSAHTPPAPRV